MSDADRSQIKRPVFKLAPQARSVTLYQCKLPTSICTDLGEQLKSRTKLRALYIPEQPDIAWEVVSSVGQMTDLIHLNLESCELTEEQCSVLCQQLQLIHHLERLDLSENPIGPKKKPNIWSNQSDPGDQMLRYSN